MAKKVKNPDQFALFDIAPEPKPKTRHGVPNFHEAITEKVMAVGAVFLVCYRDGVDKSHWCMPSTYADGVVNRRQALYDKIDVYEPDEYYEKMKAGEFAMTY